MYVNCVLKIGQHRLSNSRGSLLIVSHLLRNLFTRPPKMSVKCFQLQVNVSFVYFLFHEFKESIVTLRLILIIHCSDMWVILSQFYFSFFIVQLTAIPRWLWEFNDNRMRIHIWVIFTFVDYWFFIQGLKNIFVIKIIVVSSLLGSYIILPICLTPYRQVTFWHGVILTVFDVNVSFVSN